MLRPAPPPLGSRLRGNDVVVRGNDGLFTLTLTLSHRGRGDIEVSPEDVFGVCGVEISNPVTSKSSWHRDNPTIRRTKDYDQDGFDLSIPVPVRHLMMVSHVGRIEIDCNGSKLNHGLELVILRRASLSARRSPGS